MRIGVLGLGRVGFFMLKEVKKLYREAEIVAGDFSDDKLREAEGLGATPVKVNAEKPSDLISFFKGLDAALVGLPGDLAKNAWRAASEAGTDIVDISYSDADPFSIDAKMVFVPDAGMAPGLSNVFVGNASSWAKKIRIYSAGLPLNPTPPLNYSITWSPEDLLDMYTRPARIVRKGRVMTVPALSDLELKYVPELNLWLEAFITDGLRTLIKTVKAEEMWEKTMRFPGHADKIKLLIDLGFLSKEELMGVPVIKYSASVLSRNLPRDKDMAMVIVEAYGKGRKARYSAIDFHNGENTAMSRMTGLTAVGILRLVMENKLEKGVKPPEVIGMDEDLFNELIQWLKDKGVRITILL
ncbi:MAG: saccharopine dehydrogenase family protein [Candidatus Methanodesulfokora sp.]